MARPAPHHNYAMQNRLVRWGKFALPVVAVGLGVVIFYLAQIERENIVLPFPEVPETTEEIDSISMANARFSGRDDRNRSFTVTAEKAQQKSADSTIVHLVRPKGNLDLTDGRQVAIQAESGIYLRGDKMLNLAGDVTLSDNRGFKFHTTSASIDLDRHLAAGDAPVTGSGPSGDIAAEGFRVLEDGDRVLFTGRTNLTLTATGDAAGGQTGGAETP
jgi:lipopolysaccharide export system protein LptC